MTEVYMSMADVMQVLPVSRATANRIINSMPHIKLPGLRGKVMVERKVFEAYLRKATVSGIKPDYSPAPRKKPKHDPELTADGLIPYRKTRR